jgi:DNA-binding CsgD family transcriptional regulator
LPGFVVSGGALRSANAALAALLGTTPGALSGQPVRAWLLGVPDELSAPAQLTLTAFGADGPWRLVADVWQHEDGLEGEVLSSEPATLADVDHDYTVVAQDGPDSPFGRLLALGAMGAQVDAARLRGRCFEVLRRRTEPCPGCPLAGAAQPDEAEGEGAPVTVTTAVRAGAQARLQVRRVPVETLGVLVRRRMERLAAAHALSEREREVLLSLVLGQSIEAFAGATGIAKRTLVFHKTNLLRKLGITSQREFMARLLDGR